MVSGREGIMFLSINNILGAKIMLVHGLVKFVLLLLTTSASTSRTHSPLRQTYDNILHYLLYGAGQTCLLLCEVSCQPTSTLPGRVRLNAKHNNKSRNATAQASSLVLGYNYFCAVPLCHRNDI